MESQLLSPVRQWLAQQGFVTIHEFQTPWGISDLVGLRPNLRKVEERVSAGHMEVIGDMQAAMVLLAIPTAESHRSVSTAELKAELGYLLSEIKIDKLLERLRRKKLVAVNGANRLVRNTPWLPYHEQLVSVELKLSRVDEALAQAARHRVITSFSYVALPEGTARKVVESSKIDAFRRSGVGLLSASDRQCEVILHPAVENDGLERLHEIAAAERCWRQVLKTIDH